MACPCSWRLFVVVPGFPMKLSKKCCHVPVVPLICVCVTTPWTTLTPPPSEVEPNASWYSQTNHPTSTSENPTNIIASTFTAHFFGTRDA